MSYSIAGSRAVRLVPAHALVLSLAAFLTAGAALAQQQPIAEASNSPSHRPTTAPPRATAAPWGSAPTAAQMTPPPTPLVQTDWFTVAEAVTAMNRSNPVLLALFETDHAAEADVIAAGLWTNPLFVTTYTRGINGPSYTYDVAAGNGQFVIQQLIELANLPGARRHVAEAILDATRNDSEGFRRSLFFDLQAAILAMTEAAQRREILHETADRLAHARDVIAFRVNAGASPQYDLARIEIALATVRASEHDAEADLTAARGGLNLVVGVASRSLHGLPRFDIYPSLPLPALAVLFDAAGRLRPDIRAAIARTHAALSQIDVARRSVFQGITAYAGAAFGAGNPPAANQPGYHGIEIDMAVGVAVPLPVLDHGQGTIPAAQRRARASDYAAQALIAQARLQIESLFLEVQERRENLSSYDETTSTEANDFVRMAEAQYRDGRTQILDLVDAYTSVRDAHLQRLALANDARAAELNLARVVGSVTALGATDVPMVPVR